MTVIAVDAMGGDYAPGEIVAGVLEALAAYDGLKIKLFGPIDALKSLAGNAWGADRLEIIDAPDVITNHEAPVEAVRKKKNASLVMAMQAVKDGEAQGVISAGSTGAVLAGGIFIVGRISGVQRPALAPLLPNGKKGVLLVDCGANVDCKPAHLLQFAMMGSAYMKKVQHCDTPQVGLLNIGAEAEKGNQLVKESYGLLERAPIAFVGNVEPRDVMSGSADVLVADGFAGNMVLKSIEGVASKMMGMLKTAFLSNLKSKIAALMLKPAIMEMKTQMDYTEYGGAPLLGLKGVVVKTHGTAKAKAVRYTIRQAIEMASGGLVPAIEEGIAQLQRQAETQDVQG